MYSIRVVYIIGYNADRDTEDLVRLCMNDNNNGVNIYFR